MKLVLRSTCIAFVLISTQCVADTIGLDLNTKVFMDANYGFGDNVGVTLSGQGVGIFALGGTPTFWFDGGSPYLPGEGGLGPTTIFWDTAFLQIGSTGYDVQLDPGFLNAPGITFPTNGRDFSVSFVWTPDLSGTIISNCPSSGCGFLLAGKTGNVKLSFFYLDGAYWAKGASFTLVPEPSTFVLIAIGIGAVGCRLVHACWSGHLAL